MLTSVSKQTRSKHALVVELENDHYTLYKLVRLKPNSSHLS